MFFATFSVTRTFIFWSVISFSIVIPVMLAHYIQIYEDQHMCTICMERPKTVAFLCGHRACIVCVDGLRSCHMCRVPIQQKINLYWDTRDHLVFKLELFKEMYLQTYLWMDNKIIRKYFSTEKSKLTIEMKLFVN